MRVSTRATFLIRDTTSEHTRMTTAVAGLSSNVPMIDKKALEATEEVIAIADTVGIGTLRMGREAVEVAVATVVIAAAAGGVAVVVLRIRVTGVLMMLTGTVQAKLVPIHITELTLSFAASARSDRKRTHQFARSIFSQRLTRLRAMVLAMRLAPNAVL